MPPGNPHWRLPWQQNWLPLPICLFAPIGIMWVFVVLKGLLRSLGIRLRDHTWNNYSARSSSSLALLFLSQQPVSAGICITGGKATHCPTGVCADWEKPIKSFICVTLKRQKKFLQFWPEWLSPMNAANVPSVSICETPFKIMCSSDSADFHLWPQKLHPSKWCQCVPWCTICISRRSLGISVSVSCAWYSSCLLILLKRFLQKRELERWH